MSIFAGSVEERMPGNKCPHCGRSAEGGTSADIDQAPPRKPNPGDYAVCLYCGTLNRYGETLTLEPTTVADRRKIERDPRCAELLRVLEQVGGAVPEAAAMKTRELCLLARVTAREAQWWSEAGILKPAFINGNRDFDENDVLVAAIVAELRRKGVTLQRIRRMRLRVAAGEFLVVNGTVRFWCGREDLIPKIMDARGPCLVVCVEDLRRRLNG